MEKRNGGGRKRENKKKNTSARPLVFTAPPRFTPEPHAHSHTIAMHPPPPPPPHTRSPTPPHPTPPPSQIWSVAAMGAARDSTSKGRTPDTAAAVAGHESVIQKYRNSVSPLPPLALAPPPPSPPLLLGVRKRL